MSGLFEKIEIPEINLSGTEKAIKNIWSEIDRIAKDIQEQKDNVIAMEFTKCIGELLRKNGVVPKITEYTAEFDRGNTFEHRYGVTIDELDFSEHDKVFEDKIADLKKDYGTVSRLLSDYQQENESLKQRIAELESKETESFDEVPDDITIDGYKCKIIKTESGLYISRDEIYSIIEKEKEPLKQKCKELEDKHQSDCIEINRLNTTIDVLIHKVEYLRQFAGLE